MARKKNEKTTRSDDSLWNSKEEEEEFFSVAQQLQQEQGGENAEPLAKKDKKRSVLNIILLIVGILLIAAAVISLIMLMMNYRRSNDEYDELTEDYVTIYDELNTEFLQMSTEEPEEEEEAAVLPWYKQISVDLAGLQKKYPDIAAWIVQEGDTPINYPVMYASDDDYYLHRTYKGTYAYAGSIFMEALNNPDFNDAHTILYGHNMRNGSMFGTLKYLERKEGYINEHGYIDIYLPDEIRRYRIFSYGVTKTGSFVYQVPFGVTDEFTNFIAQLRSLSEVSVDVPVNNTDKILTLSTCYGTNTDRRFVVSAVWTDTYYYATGMTDSLLREQARGQESAQE